MAEPFISGYAVQWQQPANIGGLFLERFQRGAFDRSMVDNPDVAALWAHDVSRPLGRVGNGTLTLQSDSIGLWYAVTPNPDSPNGQEALASVGRGDVAEVSVGFWSEIEEWDDSGDIPQRLITQAGLIEVSLVLWGAYGKATSASLSRAQSNALAASRRRAEAAQRLRGIR